MTKTLKPFLTLPATLAVMTAVLWTVSASASTNNLLVNANFNSGSSGWSLWSWANPNVSSWASVEIPSKLAGTALNPPTWPSGWPGGAGTNYNVNPLAPVYDGTMQLSVGANGTGGGGAYQIIAAAPNVQYTLTVQGGAENWWLPTGQIRLFFLDASQNFISSNFVETTTSLHNGENGGLGDQYDIGVPYQNWTNSAVSPAGTAFLKVELAEPSGTGTCWFDNAYLTAPINPPVIGNLYPNGNVLLQGTNTLVFNATSVVPINGSGIDVVLNSVDISSNLVITGSGTTNVSVSYPGLKTNQIYTAAITVTDTANLVTIKSFNFDTYAPSFTWEAEDYDYNSGQFINNPILSSVATSGSYFGLSGTAGVDYYNHAESGGPTIYRPDPMSTSVCGDTPRQNFVNAGVSDYNIGYFDGAGFFSTGSNVGINEYEPQEWVNYTRTFPAGTYNLYARIAGGNGGNATVPVSAVISGQGTSSQTTTNLGAFQFPANNWGAYSYVPMTDAFGNMIKLSLSGTTTLRVSAGSGANMNFFMIVPADTSAPTITGVYPDGSTLLQGTNKMVFTASSATHSIAQSNVVVTLNGVTNTSLTFSGNSSSWNVSLPLSLNVTNYTAVISVSDNAGDNHTTTLYFDTFNMASYDIEAEDFDYNSGQYIDNPVITSVNAANSYFDSEGSDARMGTDGVDESSGSAYAPPTTADFHFRANDYIATSVCTDTPTRDLLAAQATNSLAFNYNVAWWSTNGWLNYTHTYPAGNYNVYARLAGATGNTNWIQLDKVGGSTNYLGTFIEVGRGYNAFDWIPLVNTNSGQLVAVTLGGVATLRTTTLTGNVNPNSYLLVPVVQAPPTLNASYSSGTLTLSWSGSAFHLQAQTNAVSSGLKSNWVNYSGGSSSPVNVSVDRLNGVVLFRLSN